MSIPSITPDPISKRDSASERKEGALSPISGAADRITAGAGIGAPTTPIPPVSETPTPDAVRTDLLAKDVLGAFKAGKSRVIESLTGETTSLSLLPPDKFYELLDELASRATAKRESLPFIEKLLKLPQINLLTPEQVISLHIKVYQSFSKKKGENEILYQMLSATWHHPHFKAFLSSREFPDVFASLSEGDSTEYLLDFFDYQKNQLSEPLDCTRLWGLAPFKTLTASQFGELIEEGMENEDVHFIRELFSHPIAKQYLEHTHYLKLLSFQSFLINAGELELFKQLFPIEQLANLPEKEFSAFGSPFLFKLAQAVQFSSYSSRAQFQKVLIDLVKELIRKRSKRLDCSEKFAYFQTFSTAARYEKSSIELEGSLEYISYFYHLISLEDFRDSLSPLDPQIKEINSLIKCMEQSALSSLLISCEMTSIESASMRYFQSALCVHFIHETILSMKIGEIRLFPISMIFPDEGHTIQVEVRKNSSESYTVIIYNTAPPAEAHLIAEDGKEKIYPYALHHLTDKQVIDFFGSFFDLNKVILRRNAETSIEEVQNLYYKMISAYSTTKGFISELHLRSYQTQSSVPNCTLKSISAWIHSHFSEGLYRSYKVFSQQKLIDNFKRELEKEKTKFAAEGGGDLSDLEALAAREDLELSPSETLELFKIVEAETRYTAEKHRPLHELPLDLALDKLERNPQIPYLVDEIFLHPKIKDIDQRDLLRIFYLAAVQENEEALKKIASSSLYAKICEEVMKEIDEYLALPEEEKRSFDDRKILRLIFSSIHINPEKTIKITQYATPHLELPSLRALLAYFDRSSFPEGTAAVLSFGSF